MHKSFVKIAGIMFTVFCLFLLQSPVFADGPTRSATQAERDFHSSILNTLAKAIPAGPAGWDQVQQDPLQPLRRVSEGAENRPFGVSYAIAWQDSKKLSQAEDSNLAALTQAQADQPSADTAALNKRAEELAAAIGKAAAAGDMDQVQKLQIEIESVQAKLEKIYSANDQRQHAIMSQQSARDATLKIRLHVNSFHESFYVPVGQAAPFRGAMTLRTEGRYTENHGWQEGATYVFLGPDWRFANDDERCAEAPVAAGRSHTSAQTIVVVVQADEKRASQVLELIDWTSLKKLLSK